MDPRVGAHRLQQRARAGEARRRARLRPRVGGRAPLPRGVLPLPGARAVPHRVRDGDEADPRRASASSCACRSSTTRSRSPSGPPCSTSSPAGALEVGTGRSATWTELGRVQRRARTTPRRAGTSSSAACRACGRRRRSRSRASSGRCRERTILPKVYQRPHPPMWVAVTSPGTELDAADRGLGSLGLTFGGFAEQEKKIAEYRRRIQLCEPVGEFVNDQVSTVNFLYCHEDDAVAAPPAAAWPTRSTTSRPSSSRRARRTRRSRTRRSGSCRSSAGRPSGPDADEQAGRGPGPRRPGARASAPLKRWEAVRRGPRQLHPERQRGDPAGGRARRASALFAREVMPAFSGRQARPAPASGAVSHAHVRTPRRRNHRGAAAAPRQTSTPRRGRSRARRSSSSRGRRRPRRTRSCRGRMHPAIPRYVTFLVTRYPESPVGPFVLAQVRLMGRAGAHPRGFVLGAVASTPEAADRAPRPLGASRGRGQRRAPPLPRPRGRHRDAGGPRPSSRSRWSTPRRSPAATSSTSTP